MEELFDLSYKEEVEALKDEENFEALGDEKYTYHEDMEARLYWAFCRPSGSSPKQIQDPDPIVSIMAFNHSRLPALKRFKLLHKDVIEQDNLRVKISKRTRMLFRDLVDNDFNELNKVLELVPVFLDLAVDQLINGRKWNDITADEIEASKFIQGIKKQDIKLLDEQFYKALYLKLADFEEFDPVELKDHMNMILGKKENIDKTILEYYKDKTYKYLETSDLHILQKKGLEKLADKLV